MWCLSYSYFLAEFGVKLYQRLSCRFLFCYDFAFNAKVCLFQWLVHFVGQHGWLGAGPRANGPPIKLTEQRINIFHRRRANVCKQRWSLWTPTVIDNVVSLAATAKSSWIKLRMFSLQLLQSLRTMLLRFRHVCGQKKFPSTWGSMSNDWLT